MAKISTKSDLYRYIARIRGHGGDYVKKHPINAVALCREQFGINVGYHSFVTPGLKGMANAGKTHREDVIILNNGLTVAENNFFCAHELIHLGAHRKAEGQSFTCYEKALPQQDSYIEWVANEGAAELLVPMDVILPMLKQQLPDCHCWEDFFDLKSDLAEYFGVTQQVIVTRIESLKYEIDQYMNGVPLDRIRVLSRKQQDREGIRVQSLNDYFLILLFDDTESRMSA